MKLHRLVVGSAWLATFGGGALALVACGGDTIGDTIVIDGGNVGAPSDATVGSGGDGSTTDGSSVVDTFGDGATGDDAATDAGGDANADADAAADADADADAGPGSDGGTMTAVYAGLPATLTAPSDATNVAWTLVSAPAGSSITTASIQNASTATASLPTDVPGTYTVSVTYTEAGGTTTRSFVLAAAAAHLVFGVNANNASGLATIDTDGTNGHAVICPFPGVTKADVAALGLIDTREGAPGTATKIVFGGPVATDDAGTPYARLYLTDTNGMCPPGGDAGADAAVVTQVTGSMPVPGVDEANAAHPRLSPAGTQVAFTGYAGALTTPDITSTVNVVNLDGGSPVTLGTVGESDGSKSNETSPSLGIIRQPEWSTDGTKVGWMRAEKSAGAAAGWTMVTATVSPTVTAAQTYISCPTAQTTPTRGVFLADGSIVTAYQAAANGPTDLLLLQAPTATTTTCTVARNLSNVDVALSPTGVTSFAVSPDLTTVAFTYPTAGATQSIYLASIDGTVKAHLIGSMATADVANGLRWIGGGSQIAFTHQNDAGVHTVATAWALGGDASVVTDVATPDAGQTYTAVGDGDGTGCSFGGKSAPMIGFFGGALGLLAVARRRRRGASIPSRES